MHFLWSISSYNIDNGFDEGHEKEVENQRHCDLLGFQTNVLYEHMGKDCFNCLLILYLKIAENNYAKKKLKKKLLVLYDTS